ncbi:MAG: SPOR domain-containing protein [Shewanella sp.]
MTNRDYANKSPAKKSKAKTTRRKSQAPAPRRFPLALLLVTLGLITGFGYFLWSINNSAEELTETSEIEQAEFKPAPQKAPTALPPKPKEKWTYQRELENKQVEVDIPEIKVSTIFYRMQCGSFRTQAQAEQMKAVIAFQGLESSIAKVRGTTGDWYKVSLGPYELKRQAGTHRHTLQKIGINGCIVLSYKKPV